MKIVILAVAVLFGVLLWIIGSVLYYVALAEEIQEELEDFPGYGEGYAE